MARLFIGTAGWSVPSASARRCHGPGTHLERYARVFTGAEINSSFYRPHAAATYARWRDCTPADFRFAVKTPREITHELELRRARVPFATFLEQTAGLGEKRGPLLVQLPPSLSFDARVVARFFEVVRQLYDGIVVCEPRHSTWFSGRAAALLQRFRIALVAADPPPASGADIPDGWTEIAYFRLHGSPRKYWSRYETVYIAGLAATVRGLLSGADVWCVFDNTAGGAALENAWELQALLDGPNTERRGGAVSVVPITTS